MIYITGDTHSDFRNVHSFCHVRKTSREDILIILGDAGINYYGDARDRRLKKYLAHYSITLFCIHGNHEIRPQNIPSYRTMEFCGGTVLYEEEFPNILFAIDGEVYELNGQWCLVIGGAYSIDKDYRLFHGYGWWEDEQPSQEIKERVEKKLTKLGNRVDAVFSHTCPLRYEPTEAFIPGIPQESVDKSTEQWLGGIEARLDYQRWYCGHFHISKEIDRIKFMYKDFAELPTGGEPCGTPLGGSSVKETQLLYSVRYAITGELVNLYDKRDSVWEDGIDCSVFCKGNAEAFMEHAAKFSTDAEVNLDIIRDGKSILVKVYPAGNSFQGDTNYQLNIISDCSDEFRIEKEKTAWGDLVLYYRVNLHGGAEKFTV